MGKTRDHGAYITLGTPEQAVTGREYAASRGT